MASPSDSTQEFRSLGTPSDSALTVEEVALAEPPHYPTLLSTKERLRLVDRDYIWAGRVGYLLNEVAKLRSERDVPEVENFVRGIQSEVTHQRNRWGSSHDAGKSNPDWFWLVGYLAGKALRAAETGDTNKALHHTISTAAALANWHAALSGENTRMRPGIEYEDDDTDL